MFNESTYSDNCDVMKETAKGFTDLEHPITSGTEFSRFLRGFCVRPISISFDSSFKSHITVNQLTNNKREKGN